MAKRKTRSGKEDPALARSPDAFAASLARRARAARGLEQDLLTEVPLLYGSPDRLAPRGDPGIVLARLHQEDLQRRHGVLQSPRRDADVRLPFERTMAVLAALFFLWVLFGR